MNTEVGSGLAASDREAPLTTKANGTLMAQRS
jgi:hypothetical protein